MFRLNPQREHVPMLRGLATPRYRQVHTVSTAALEQPHAVDTLTASSLRFRSGRCRQVPLMRNVRTRCDTHRMDPAVFA